MIFIIKQGDREVARVTADKLLFSKKYKMKPGTYDKEEADDKHLFKVVDDNGKALVVIMLSNTSDLTIEQC